MNIIYFRLSNYLKFQEMFTKGSTIHVYEK